MPPIATITVSTNLAFRFSMGKQSANVPSNALSRGARSGPRQTNTWFFPRSNASLPPNGTSTSSSVFSWLNELAAWRSGLVVRGVRRMNRKLTHVGPG